MNMDINTLKTGDLIVRQKGPFSTHYIVWIGWQNGIQLVAENQRGLGVRYTSLQEALAGNSIKRFEKFGGTEVQRQLVVPKIKNLLGKSYDLMVFNCEHFARWIATGKIESKQVRTASTIAITAGLSLLASKNDAVKVVGVLGIIAGFVGHISQSR
jgi:hypothetical protein